MRLSQKYADHSAEINAFLGYLTDESPRRLLFNKTQNKQGAKIKNTALL